MFWNNFYSTCIKKGIKPNTLAKELQIASGSMTAWKNGKLPNGETLLKIANYLDISVDYLLGRTDETNSNLIKAKDIDNINQKNLDKETIEIAEMIKNLSLIERSKVVLFIEQISKQKEESLQYPDIQILQNSEQKTYPIPTAARRGINGKYFSGNTEYMTQDEINAILNAEDGDEDL